MTGAVIDKVTLFNEFVYYHYENNILPNQKSTNENLVQGASENSNTKGLLLFYDGQKVLKKIGKHAILGKKSIKDTIDVENFKDITEVIKEQNDDCTFLLNTTEGKITTMRGQLNNGGYKPKKLLDLIHQCLPKNILSDDGSVPMEEAGGKTLAPVTTLNRYKKNDVRAIVIKQAVHKNGWGKILHYGTNGRVTAEAHFFKDKKDEIQGRYILYHHKNGSLEVADTYSIDMKEIKQGKVEYTVIRPEKEILEVIKTNPLNQINGSKLKKIVNSYI